MKPTNLTIVLKNPTGTVTETYASIKLGVDAHAKWYDVARQLDGPDPQAEQKVRLPAGNH